MRVRRARSAVVVGSGDGVDDLRLVEVLRAPITGTKPTGASMAIRFLSTVGLERCGPTTARRYMGVNGEVVRASVHPLRRRPSRLRGRGSPGLGMSGSVRWGELCGVQGRTQCPGQGRGVINRPEAQVEQPRLLSETMVVDGHELDATRPQCGDEVLDLLGGQRARGSTTTGGGRSARAGAYAARSGRSRGPARRLPPAAPPR